MNIKFIQQYQRKEAIITHLTLRMRQEMPPKPLLPTYQTSHTPDSIISITNSGAKCIKLNNLILKHM